MNGHSLNVKITTDREHVILFNSNGNGIIGKSVRLKTLSSSISKITGDREVLGLFRILYYALVLACIYNSDQHQLSSSQPADFWLTVGQPQNIKGLWWTADLKMRWTFCQVTIKLSANANSFINFKLIHLFHAKHLRDWKNIREAETGKRQLNKWNFILNRKVYRTQFWQFCNWSREENSRLLVPREMNEKWWWWC